MGRLSLSLLLLSATTLVSSQPSPQVQKRITAAIRAAANQTNPDLTAFVNPFVGTGEFLWPFPAD
jgi:hypothetical protein